MSLGPNAESRLYKIAHCACAFQRPISGIRVPENPARSSECKTLSGNPRIPRFDLRLVVQNHVQQGIMDLKFSVVFDKAQFTELVHKKAHARPGRADHLRQSLLTELSHDRLRLTFLAKICKQKEKASQALFARIKQLVDQVLFNSAVPRQQIRHEQFGKVRLVMNGGDHDRFLYASNHTFIGGSGGCDAQRMAIQTSFAKKVAGSQDCDDCFLALLGNDRELDLALLDVENRVRDLSLRKDNLILPIFGYRFSLAHIGEKCSGIKRGFSSLPHKASLFLSPKGCPFPRCRQGEAGAL